MAAIAPSSRPGEGEGGKAAAADGLPGPLFRGAELADRAELWPARELARRSGRVSAFVTEAVTAPDGAVLTRDWLRHPGAVAVIALDAAERLAVVAQYRHPAGFV
ncbi:MAG: hypothetical protein LBI84_10570, partial [Propionibacteriaceae bacterium]|nr:hypothetical protein [Propionibacteriaceae bacterium]